MIIGSEVNEYSMESDNNVTPTGHCYVSVFLLLFVFKYYQDFFLEGKRVNFQLLEPLVLKVDFIVLRFEHFYVKVCQYPLANRVKQNV